MPALFKNGVIMVFILEFIRGLFFKPHDEPAYEEDVEHDTVMAMVDGHWTEVTIDDPEVRQ